MVGNMVYKNENSAFFFLLWLLMNADDIIHTSFSENILVSNQISQFCTFV